LESVHSVTRPSDDTEKKLRFLARSSSCQQTSHTGSVCLPFLTVDWKMGALFLDRVSNTATVPSYSPTHSTDECCGCQSRHMTPDSVWQQNSGKDGFFNEYRHRKPIPCFMKSKEP
jgi:hypothetical protein